MALVKAIERHGGISLWENLEYVLLEVKFLRGPMPIAKGVGRTFPQIGKVKIYPKEQKIIFYDVAGSELGVFAAGKIIQNNIVIDSNYRKRFTGFAKLRRWSAADAMYFWGAALVTYVSVPFILPGIATKHELTANGLRVEAEFPKDFHTHNRHQSFYFDREGLLFRHNYRAEIVNGLAAGAHFSSEYKVMNGLPIACKRVVYARIGRLVLPIKVLEARLEPLTVAFSPK